MKFAEATNINRKSGVAEWRDLLFRAFPITAITCAANLYFVIPTGAKRSGGTCFSVHFQ
jgi:hypothetical protein